MIPAHKRPIFNFLLRRWLVRVLHRRFHGIYVIGLEHLETLELTRPVVGCVNHTNWWDGFVLYVLSHRLIAHDIYLAMEEKNLLRYRFFSWMGVFGVDLTGERSALPGLRYALGLLRARPARPAKLIWMFVQGKLTRPAVRVEVKGGANFLAARTSAALLPLTLRYEWLGESRPSIFVRIGAALPSDTTADSLAGALNELLEATDFSLESSGLNGYELLFEPSPSMNKRWDLFVHRCFRRRGVFDQRNNYPR